MNEAKLVKVIPLSTTNIMTDAKTTLKELLDNFDTDEIKVLIDRAKHLVELLECEAKCY